MFSLYQTSGFYFAPVSKALVGCSVIASIALNFPLGHWRYWFRFNYSTIFMQYDFLRYLAYRCIFLDPKDIMCAGIILYHFRIFERRYGSLKFASYVLCNFCVSMVLELALVYALHRWEIDMDPFPTGPYGVIFSLYIVYFCDIPRVAYTHVMGVPVTGKSLTYIIGLQLLSGSVESSILALIGLLSGLLVKANFLWIQRWFFIPRFIGSFCSSTIGRLLYTPKPAEPNLPMGATLEIQRQQQIERLEQQMVWAQLNPRNQGLFNFGLFGGNRQNNRNGFGGPIFMPQHHGNNQPQPQAGQNNHAEAMDEQGAPNPNEAASSAPPDEQVQRLVEMGFNRESVMNALRVSNNDINIATNILLHEA